MTHAIPLKVTLRLVVYEQDKSAKHRAVKDIKEQEVYLGELPLMTEKGTFIINGTERVVVTQLVRSPGAYLMEPKDREKQVFTANLMPARGSWLELEIDKKGKVFVRIDRKRKLPVTVLLRAMTYNPETDGAVEESVEDIERLDQELVDLFDGSLYIRNTIESDPDNTKTKKGALIELFKKQRPGEPPSVDAAYALLQQLFFDPKRYDLTRVGRYKLNSRLNLDIDLDTRTLTHDDIHALVRDERERWKPSCVKLTRLEFKTLKYLAQNPGRVIARDELLNQVWGYKNYPCTRTVDNHILRLRQKLERDACRPIHFQTMHGVGYKFLP
jgi:DNA-directed RNA polymerase subunit beta